MAFNKSTVFALIGIFMVICIGLTLKSYASRKEEAQNEAYRQHLRERAAAAGLTVPGQPDSNSRPSTPPPRPGEDVPPYPHPQPKPNNNEPDLEMGFGGQGASSPPPPAYAPPPYSPPPPAVQTQMATYSSPAPAYALHGSGAQSSEIRQEQSGWFSFGRLTGGRGREEVIR